MLPAWTLPASSPALYLQKRHDLVVEGIVGMEGRKRFEKCNSKKLKAILMLQDETCSLYYIYSCLRYRAQN